MQFTDGGNNSVENVVSESKPVRNNLFEKWKMVRYVFEQGYFVFNE